MEKRVVVSVGCYVEIPEPLVYSGESYEAPDGMTAIEARATVARLLEKAGFTEIIRDGTAETSGGTADRGGEHPV